MPRFSTAVQAEAVNLPATSNHAPSDDLAPYIARFFVTIVDQAGSESAEDILLNEGATVHLPVEGDWAWQAGAGDWQALEAPMLFGPRGRAMRIRARGGAMMVGFVIRPGGWLALDTRPASAVADCAEAICDAWGPALDTLPIDASDPLRIVARLEEVIRDRIRVVGAMASPKAARFEAMVRAESNIPVTRAASHLGMTSWTFDRFVRRHFGHAPKIVLRRSRFLDMAGVMHGLAAPDTDALAPIRFYDASHLNREFRTFIDMTPGVFARAHTPLLNAELAARQLLAG